MRSILLKFKEVVLSVLPIVVLVLILNFTITPLGGLTLSKFLLGSLFIVIGMPIFLLGIDIGIEPIGDILSHAMIRSNRTFILLAGVLFIGFLISIAEPDLHILAQQVSNVTGGSIGKFQLVFYVSMGIGALLSLGIYRILRSIPLKVFFSAIYLIIFVLSLFSDQEFLAIAFDASGATTGSITVPFMLAIAAGVSSMTRSHKKEGIDSFGLLGIASAGAILAVLILGLFTPSGSLHSSLPSVDLSGDSVFLTFIKTIPTTTTEAILAMAPIMIIFLSVNAIWIKISKSELRNILIGTAYTLVGLIFFLTGVNAGFIEASNQVGYQMATLGKPWLLVMIGMIFGSTTIPAEPSVQILTQQIEEQTAGSIKAKIVMISLAIGVAIAVGLSILRILIPGLLLWHILLPVMIISLALAFIVPDIFVGIAFDSGGVASGTMTATFILPFAQGVAHYIPTADVLFDAFGVIAIVAITPLITVQLLGFIFYLQQRPRKTGGEEEKNE